MYCFYATIYVHNTAAMSTQAPFTLRLQIIHFAANAKLIILKYVLFAVLFKLSRRFL
jgi:hypothetical protein